MSQLKLLLLGDSPTVHTGFANVIRNLSRQFHPHFERGIDLWAINYGGWPQSIYPYKFYPAGFGDWVTNNNLTRLLNLIYAEDYTHVFFLCNCHSFLPAFTDMLKRVLKNKLVDGKMVPREKPIHFTFYYPVDSPLEKEWLHTVALADAPVTYTEFGRRESNLARPGLNPTVIPHGADFTVYRPLECDRNELRKRLFGKWVQPDDFLFVNVNRNERRKAPQNTLQIHKMLMLSGIRSKLYLHMPQIAQDETTDLNLVAAQLGLPAGDTWSHGDKFFINYNGLATEEGMNDIYNAADFVLTTTLAEGWGLSLTEGLSCGCRVIAPDNSSCGEIGRMVQKYSPGQFTLLPLSPIAITNMLDSSRVRYPVDIEKAVPLIVEQCHDLRAKKNRFAVAPEIREFLSWERIGNEFLKLMKVI